jgi:dTDP-4-amino-4,6-dideoxygalactose transaminase
LNYRIPFNKPCVSESELKNVSEAVTMGKLSGNGFFTKSCNNFFEKRYCFKKVLLTSSCTQALEMVGILLDLKPNDEIILPAYTFVSTANAFVLRGAKLVFCDSENQHPNIDVRQIEKLITPKTRAIVIVHYAGVACDMTKIMELSKKYNLFVIEDSAHAIDSFHLDARGEKKALGTFGDFATFSFHETKNIICGEGGMLVINNEQFFERADIIWEKGTNRKAFLNGEVAKYDWVDIGSSFLPSEITAAFLWGQIERLDLIQEKRRRLWENYHNRLADWARQHDISLPFIPAYSIQNYHIFYLICQDELQRDQIINHLGKNEILAVFHYQSLHKSKFFDSLHDHRDLKHADRFSSNLVRLPLFYDLKNDEVIDCLLEYS